ncbi:MAG TPA: amidohydrolase family protein [Chloroflexota bacterium]|jgi:predicted TIM-barrel fold metal-dependent hydrolase
MATIDSDAHVVESDRTWEYLDPADRQYRPRIVHPEGGTQAFWFIDGKTRGLARSVLTAQQFAELSARAGRRMDTSEETRAAENVPARLHHMDELGIDVQVLYPTVFIESIADKAEVEIALCKAYNRWLADIWSQGQGRLRWACVVPTLAIDEAVKEIDFARRNGACAIYMRGIEGTRLLQDPYFDPIYERAQDLDLAIGVHIANGNPWLIDLLGQRNGGGAFWKFRLASVGAFHSVIMSGLMERFPRLRMGFLEASAQWLPYVLKDLKRRLPGQGRALPDNPLQEYRLYVSCQTDDDVPYLLGYAGEDNLVIGTDYGHNDQSTEIEALRNLREGGSLDERVYAKITDANARALYAL